MQISENYGSQEEETIDLVICNDDVDIFYPDLVDFMQHEEGEGALIVDMAIALLENQLVLCTQSLWLSLQNLVQIWQNFIQKSEKELIEQFESGMSLFQTTKVEKLKFVFEKYAYRKAIKEEKALVEQLNRMYLEFYETMNQVIDSQEKYKKAQELLEKFKKEDFFETSYINDVYLLFWMHVFYQIILEQEYTCKMLKYEKSLGSDDYLLFIPKNITTNFDWDNLQKYDHKVFKSNAEIQDCFFRMENYLHQNQLGLELLKVLKVLISRKKNKNEKISFFNVFLVGHGDENCIAEISIELKENPLGQKESDFLKILHFFQYQMQTKSLGIISCFSGGQKIGKAFDISNQFNNLNLEKITYPIILLGSFFAPTFLQYHIKIPFAESKVQLYTEKLLYGPSAYINNNMYQNYFKCLNQAPINYEGAAQSISQVFNFSVKWVNRWSIANFVSIKYPNTSWFVPIELKTEEEFQKIQNLSVKKLEQIQKKQRQFEGILKDDNLLEEVESNRLENIAKKYEKFGQKISQIEALNQSIIKINQDKKVILLQANFIDTLILANSVKLPIFLAINHYNQNYVIQKITAPLLPINHPQYTYTQVHEIIHNLLPVEQIQEPINIVIKELQGKSKIIKNIYAFTQRTLKIKKYNFPDEESLVSGYMYTDVDNVTKIATWPADENYPTQVKERSFPLKKLQECIAEVEQNACKNQKDFSEVSKTLKKQQLSTIPKYVVESREKFEKENEFQRFGEEIEQDFAKLEQAV